MAEPSTPWESLLKDALFPTLKSMVETSFHKCATDGCGKRSPGNWAVCHTCSRRVCFNHGFLTIEAPPQVICTTCIVTETASPRR